MRLAVCLVGLFCAEWTVRGFLARLQGIYLDIIGRVMYFDFQKVLRHPVYFLETLRVRLTACARKARRQWSLAAICILWWWVLGLCGRGRCWVGIDALHLALSIGCSGGSGPRGERRRNQRNKELERKCQYDLDWEMLITRRMRRSLDQSQKLVSPATRERWGIAGCMCPLRACSRDMAASASKGVFIHRLVQREDV